jgi:hypothetical protein
VAQRVDIRRGCGAEAAQVGFPIVGAVGDDVNDAVKLRGQNFQLTVLSVLIVRQS